MAKLAKICRGNYTNIDAVENVIRYVTRTRVNEDRVHELIYYGGAGIGWHFGVEQMILQFQCVQNIYKIKNRQGRRIGHEAFTLDYDEFAEINCDWKILNMVARECCQVYFAQGFQVLYGIHNQEGKKPHIHFVMNSINFRDGRKWHSSGREDYIREKMFNEYLNQYKRLLHPLNICDLYD